jgi:hypothetical protein
MVETSVRNSHGSRVKTIAGVLIGLLSCAAFPGHADTIKIAAQRFPPQLGNPYSPIAQPHALPLQAIYDPLTRIGPEGRAEPGLAL